MGARWSEAMASSEELELVWGTSLLLVVVGMGAAIWLVLNKNAGILFVPKNGCRSPPPGPQLQPPQAGAPLLSGTRPAAAEDEGRGAGAGAGEGHGHEGDARVEPSLGDEVEQGLRKRASALRPVGARPAEQAPHRLSFEPATTRLGSGSDGAARPRAAAPAARRPSSGTACCGSPRAKASLNVAAVAAGPVSSFPLSARKSRPAARVSQDQGIQARQAAAGGVGVAAGGAPFPTIDLLEELCEVSAVAAPFAAALGVERVQGRPRQGSGRWTLLSKKVVEPRRGALKAELAVGATVILLPPPFPPFL